MSRFIVGVTGGVASGKSELTRLFQALGIAVADADLAARAAVAPGTQGLAEVVRAFGPEILDDVGNLDRPAMRQRIFYDPIARSALEAIIHPRVRVLLQAECAAAQSPYAIAAIPLLTESGGREAYPWLDRILVVDVPTDVQRARLLKRDGIDLALADRMITQQATRDQRLAIADDVVRNTGSLQDLRERVEGLHRTYFGMACAA